jgi:hypothetical protein
MNIDVTCSIDDRKQQVCRYGYRSAAVQKSILSLIPSRAASSDSPRWTQIA